MTLGLTVAAIALSRLVFVRAAEMSVASNILIHRK